MRQACRRTPRDLHLEFHEARAKAPLPQFLFEEAHMVLAARDTLMETYAWFYPCSPQASLARCSFSSSVASVRRRPRPCACVSFVDKGKLRL